MWTSPQVKTRRVRLTWLEVLLLWDKAYETKVSDGQQEVAARGLTAEASQIAALNRWNETIRAEKYEPPRN
jgi:hypothetical protein